MSKSGAFVLICVCFPGHASLFGSDMHNAVSTVAAPGSVFIYIRKSSGLLSKFFRGEEIHQAVARK